MKKRYNITAKISGRKCTARFRCNARPFTTVASALAYRKKVERNGRGAMCALRIEAA